MIIDYTARAIASLLAIFIHEYTKALVSVKLGDRVPINTNRLTLNPFKHVDIIGIICMFVFGLGWGKPVETSAVHYKDKKVGTILTYTMPSVVNILAGLFIMLVVYVLKNSFGLLTTVNSHPHTIETILFIIAKYNISLAVFNIIPIAPLDASRILNLFLTPNGNLFKIRYEKIFQIILVMLIFGGYINLLIDPIVNLFLSF